MDTKVDLLKCEKCGKKFRKLDKHTYTYACKCLEKNAKGTFISVG